MKLNQTVKIAETGEKGKIVNADRVCVKVQTNTACEWYLPEELEAVIDAEEILEKIMDWLIILMPAMIGLVIFVSAPAWNKLYAAIIALEFCCLSAMFVPFGWKK